MTHQTLNLARRDLPGVPGAADSQMSSPMSADGGPAPAAPRQYRAAAFNDLDVESNLKSSARIAFAEERCAHIWLPPFS